MSGFPTLLRDPDIYDYVLIKGERSPGTVTITGLERKVDWDIKDGPGIDGASMTRKSSKPVEITLAFYLADDDDFDRWQDYAALINTTIAGSAVKALDIYHPDLAAENFSSFVLSSMGVPVSDGLGGATWTVKLIEYKPPKPKPASGPSGSKGKVDPNQDLQDEIAALTNQYQKTPWGV